MGDGQIREEVLEARRTWGDFRDRTRQRLVRLFSSDVYALSINGPAFDQLMTMSKFLCLGIELVDAIRSNTAGPAALGTTDIGTLEIGAVGDATVLELAEGEFEYRDVLGEVRAGRHRIKARGLVVSGRWWHPPRA
jgi:dihydroorotase